MTLTVSLNAQEEEFGLASYYSDDFHGRKTAYGDYYDKNKLTAAHKKYAYGTKIKVTRLDNNKSVVVTVTDKGPYIKGRVVDLSRRAAESIGLVADGVAQVKVELVGKSSNRQTEAATASRESSTRPDNYDTEPETPPAATTSTPARTSSTSTAASTTTEKPAAKPAATTSSPETTASKTATASKVEKAPAEEAIKFKLVQQDYNQYGLYKIVLQKPEQKGFGVQVASLSNYENVLKQVADLQAKWFDNILISAEKGGQSPVYKVILGPFTDEKSAENYQSSLSKKYKIKGFVINLEEIEY
ncbi:MAG: septal ring lytic transglycosylase RlpA family protein [Saprospiraceae bacterium]